MSWSMSSSSLRQRLIEILDQVLGVFDSHREAHQAVGDADGLPLFRRHGPVAGGSGVHNQRAGIAQAGSAEKNLHSIHDALATLVTSLDFETHHGAEGLHLPL